MKGVIHGCRYRIPALRRAGGGSMVNTASFVASVGAATPMGRFGQASEMANAALFLASDESSDMAGGNLLVDGRLTAGSVTPE